ncbi:3-deoxy-D-arabinoheptulosonate-7-phosphate synthase [Actinopolymorpha singaporensis]|uniref:Phospho-2-dehydro-3-deoxyheptonate aldolase n=1 Tax=Actinopolymorpha singaporensis TaxID=117157 RepID=A0A1H1XG36_9ACTN|nr:3-deoxy-D-arabinoheptulosonate-7-phosphate synthase [Actinopolymorpha singaporensis]
MSASPASDSVTAPSDAVPGSSDAVPGSQRALSDVRITRSRPLLSPALLRDELPLPDDSAQVVVRGRDDVTRILAGEDDRLLVVVGPCSIHDPKAGLEYARKLAAFVPEVAADLCVVMRVYFEKPRTTLGWKGLINDPDLDGSYNVNKGLRTARKVLLDVLATGLPAGCEFLDPIIPQYIADTVSWGAIGARTSESQVHRHLASGLSMPVGFKNSTGGDVQGAIDAIGAAAVSHVFTGVTEDGVAAILTTSGNPDCHVILRGGQTGPNYDAAGVTDALGRLAKADLREHVVVDASHGNSGKDHLRQPVVAADVAAQVAAGQRGIVGVMLESFLEPGRQNLVEGAADKLRYGQSITDACMGWEPTVEVLRELAAGVRSRRSVARTN